MGSNINFFQFILYKHFSENKQHTYTHNGYTMQMLLVSYDMQQL